MAEDKATAPAAAPAFNFDTISAEPVDKLFEGTGRGATPLPDSIVKAVEASYNPGGKPKVLKVKLGSEAEAKRFKTLLEKAGNRHTPPLTVRKTTEADKVTVRFVAGPKVAREAKPAAPAAAPAPAPAAPAAPAETQAKAS